MPSDPPFRDVPPSLPTRRFAHALASLGDAAKTGVAVGDEFDINHLPEGAELEIVLEGDDVVATVVNDDIVSLPARRANGGRDSRNNDGCTL